MLEEELVRQGLDRHRHLQAGDTVSVICTDPGAKNDIPAWCRINGHKVLDITTDNNEIIITIEVN